MFPLSISAILTILPAVIDQRADSMWQTEVKAAAARGFVLEASAIPVVPGAENVLGQPWLKRWIVDPARSRKIQTFIRRVEDLERKESEKRMWVPPDERVDPLSPEAVLAGRAELAGHFRRSAPTLASADEGLSPAAEIVHFTNQFKIPWEEILDAADRPMAALPEAEPDSKADSNLSSPILPEPLANASSVTLLKLIQWRTSALLVEKKNRDAFRCIRLLCRISEAWLNEPNLHEFITGTSIDSQWLSLAGHGIKFHLWSDHELSQIAELASPPDIPALHRKTVSAGLRYLIRTVDHVAANPGYPDQQRRELAQVFQAVEANVRKSIRTKAAGKDGENVQEENESRTEPWLAALPSGAFDLYKLAMIRETLHAIPETVDLQVLRNWAVWDGEKHTRTEFTARGLLYMVADRTLLQIAAALERHRLKFGQYPGTIAELVPDFLPAVLTDPCTGDEPFYRLNEDGGCEIRMDYRKIKMQRKLEPGTNRREDPAERRRMEWTLPPVKSAQTPQSNKVRIKSPVR